jgi:hypothetical protein
MAKYQIEHPKNRKNRGAVGNRIKQTGIDPGDRTVTIVDIVDCSWSKKELFVGESIDANIETSGVKDGTKIYISIYERELGKPDVWWGDFVKNVSGNKAKLTWKYPEISIVEQIPTYRSQPVIFFSVTLNAECKDFSSEIPLYSELKIKVLKEDGSNIVNEKIVLTQSNGQVKPYQTNAEGKIEVEKVWPGYHKIKFPNSARILPDQIITGINPIPEKLVIVAMGSKVNVFKLIDTYVYCSHKSEGQTRSAGNIKEFEVAPDSTGKDAYKDEVMILSRTATSLQVNGTKLEKKENEFGMRAFLLKCEQDNKLVPNIFSLDFWKGLAVPKEYPISGLPRPLTIKCYRPDLYKFQIKFPALRKWSGGTKVEKVRGNVDNDLKSKKSGVYERDKKPVKREGWHLNKWPVPFSSDAPIVLQRNGAEISSEFIKAVGAFIELANKTTAIISAIQKYAPKVGWYFEWDNQILKGTFVLEWGWKEYKDNRVYYYIGANIDVKLIEFKMELGVGLSGFSYKIQVFGAITGGVSLSVKFSRYSPDGETEFSVPFGAEIIGMLGARAEIGCFVKMEGTVETGIKLEEGAFKFRQNEGYSIECTLKWSGIVGKFKVSAGTAKKEGVDEVKEQGEDPEFDEKASSTYERELIGSRDLGKWEWSSKHQPECKPPVISANDLHKLLKEKLDAADIQVKIGEGMFGNKYMSNDDVAKQIESGIHARNDIRMDPKSAEALVLEIQQSLEASMMRRFHGLTSYLDPDQLKSFLDGGELKYILDKDIDPMQELINKHS